LKRRRLRDLKWFNDYISHTKDNRWSQTYYKLLEAPEELLLL